MHTCEIFRAGFDLIAVHVALFDPAYAVIERVEPHIINAALAGAAIIERDLPGDVDAGVVIRIQVMLEHFG